jgi:hypothetical protein
VQAIIVKDLTHNASGRNLELKEMRFRLQEVALRGSLQERYWERQKTTRSSERAYGDLTLYTSTMRRRKREKTTWRAPRARDS